jgi:hypothetical protein
MTMTEMAAAAVKRSDNNVAAKRHVLCCEGISQQKTEDGHQQRWIRQGRHVQQ